MYRGVLSDFVSSDQQEGFLKYKELVPHNIPILSSSKDKENKQNSYFCGDSYIKMPTVIPESRDVAIKAGLEVSMITVLALPMIYLHIIIKDYQPTVRGFFCDDENIKHPYLDVSTPGQIILQMIFSS